MAQLTAEERDFLTSHLTRSREIVLNEIAGMRPDQWAFRPDEETWSMGECADHILTIERLVFSLVSKAMQAQPSDPVRGAEVQGKTAKMLRAVPAREVRIKVPAGIVNHTHTASPEEFAGPFEEQRARLIEYVAASQDPVHDRVAPHPVFQELDGCQWILLAALHGERHANQMAELKQHPAFPK